MAARRSLALAWLRPGAVMAAAQLAHRSPRCEESRPNPLAKGVSPATIEAFVDRALADPAINIAAIPDWLERGIYRSTVKLVLDLVYRGVGKLHGLELIGGHRIDVCLDGAVAVGPILSEAPLNTEALDAMVDRLMANAVVNSPLVPDFLERQIYTNCLRLVFTLVDALASTVRLQICGNELRLDFVAVNEPRSPSNNHQLSASRVDNETLDALVQAALLDQPPMLAALPFYRRFLAAIHRAIVAAALAVIDDLLDNTELRVIDEKVKLVLAPSGVPDVPSSITAAANPPKPQIEAVEELRSELEAARRRARLATWVAAAVIAFACLQRHS